MPGYDDLYGGTPPHQPTDTSVAAAVSKTGSALSERTRVFRHLHQLGGRGGTDEEIQDWLGMAQNTERPRRRELVLKDEVVDSGLRRPTRSGRKAIVWVVNLVRYPNAGQASLFPDPAGSVAP